MKAHYINDDGDLRVIRPFVYIRERQLREFANNAQLPVIEDNCPACFAKPTQRQHMKELLAAQEADYPTTFKTLLSTMRPLMADGMLSIDALQTAAAASFTPEPRGKQHQQGKNFESTEQHRKA